MMAAINTWATRHAQTAVGTLGRLAEHWFATMFMVFVIGIALALPACLHIVLDNARLAGGDWNRAVEIAAYFKAGTRLTEVETVAAVLRRRADVAGVRVIAADAAMAEFRQRSGFGAALDALTENPLPHAMTIRPRVTERGALEELANVLREARGVEHVQLDTAWVERFNAILEILQRAAWVIAALLGVGVIVIIGNAIRADIQLRRDEIEIVKLVGGSDAFVRRPFLYQGLWYGLGGGLLALMIAIAVVAVLSAPVRRLAALYGSSFRLSGLDLADAGIVLGMALALGWAGSYLAATRHLRQVQPK